MKTGCVASRVKSCGRDRVRKWGKRGGRMTREQPGEELGKQ